MIPSKIVRTGEMLLKVTETTVTLFKQGNLAKLSPPSWTIAKAVRTLGLRAEKNWNLWQNLHQNGMLASSC